MIMVDDQRTVVLAGIFNPAILTPNWVAVNVLGRPAGEEFPVQVQGPVLGAVGPLPRVTFDGISYTPLLQSVLFHMQGLDAVQSQRVCTAAGKILELLPHTPVTGVGFNFVFQTEQPRAEFLALLTTSTQFAESLGGGADTVARGWMNLVSWGDSVVNVQCEVRGQVSTTSMNFHYPVSSAQAGAAILKQADAYAKHRTAAMNTAQALMHEAIE